MKTRETLVFATLTCFHYVRVISDDSFGFNILFYQQTEKANKCVWNEFMQCESFRVNSIFWQRL